MARYSRIEVWQEIENVGLVCLFYNDDVRVAKKVVRAIYDGGGRIVEFTNRGDRAHEVFRDLVVEVVKNGDNLILGAGSVLDPVTAGLYIDLGADFIIGPSLNPDVARLCNRLKVPYIPGCATPSEISAAEELGAEICKIFPAAELGGPAYIKALRAPCPWLKLMPTGGIDATEDSLRAWFKAGVTCVGIGSSLVREDWVDGEKWDEITALTTRCIDWIRRARVEAAEPHTE